MHLRVYLLTWHGIVFTKENHIRNKKNPVTLILLRHNYSILKYFEMLVSRSSYTGQKILSTHTFSTVWIIASTTKSCHVQGFTWLIKVSLIMAPEDICEALTPDILHSNISTWTFTKTMRRTFYFTKIKVSKYTAFRLIFIPVIQREEYEQFNSSDTVCIYKQRNKQAPYSEGFSGTAATMCTGIPLNTVHEQKRIIMSCENVA